MQSGGFGSLRPQVRILPLRPGTAARLARAETGPLLVVVPVLVKGAGCDPVQAGSIPVDYPSGIRPRGAYTHLSYRSKVERQYWTLKLRVQFPLRTHQVHAPRTRMPRFFHRPTGRFSPSSNWKGRRPPKPIMQVRLLLGKPRQPADWTLHANVNQTVAGSIPVPSPFMGAVAQRQSIWHGEINSHGPLTRLSVLGAYASGEATALSAQRGEFDSRRPRSSRDSGRPAVKPGAPSRLGRRSWRPPGFQPRRPGFDSLPTC